MGDFDLFQGQKSLHELGAHARGPVGIGHHEMRLEFDRFEVLKGYVTKSQ